MAAGCVAIFSSGLSYSSSFSTVLRTTAYASLSSTVTREDAVGQDPLPKHLAKATITFKDDDTQGKGFQLAAKKKEQSDVGEGRDRLLPSQSERFATW